jgi:uncharacterized OB-fold protein
MTAFIHEGLWGQNKGRPALIGSCCKECGAKFFPVSKICLRCGCENLDKIFFSRRGTIYAFSRVFLKTPEINKVPYTVGYILLDDGISVPARICCPEEHLRIGMPVVLDVGVIKNFSDGEEMDGYFFKVEGEGGEI